MTTRWICGNWKMHGTRAETRARVAELCRLLPRAPAAVRIVIFPPFTALDVAAAQAGPQLELGAQNVGWAERGALTGEVAPPMLAELGCRFVIVGHSERRHLLGETDAVVAKRLAAAWRGGLTPLLCVGETLEERDAGRTGAVLAGQLRAALAGTDPAPLLIAYEPVWAIGTGRAAAPPDCAAGLKTVRAVLAELWGDAVVPCLYGGSVTADNSRPFWDAGGADGALVGGASLDPEAFAAICRAASGEAEA